MLYNRRGKRTSDDENESLEEKHYNHQMVHHQSAAKINRPSLATQQSQASGGNGDPLKDLNMKYQNQSAAAIACHQPSSFHPHPHHQLDPHHHHHLNYQYQHLQHQLSQHMQHMNSITYSSSS